MNRVEQLNNCKSEDLSDWKSMAYELAEEIDNISKALDSLDCRVEGLTKVVRSF